MNLDPNILAQAAFLDRPKSIKDMNRVVGMKEERISASRKRLRANPHDKGESRGGMKPWDAPWQGPLTTSWVAGDTVEFWGCGQTGHYQRVVPGKPEFGKRAGVRWAKGTRAKLLSSLHMVAAAPLESPLWVLLGLKVRRVPALVDTGAQYSFMRSDIFSICPWPASRVSFTYVHSCLPWLMVRAVG